ncbi:MAG: hypothetical protein ICV60_17850 [Pyrinomonadaceae bacterium]|nr:hypothetical protein [Pyrinomonadaceae bacterium]
MMGAAFLGLNPFQWLAGLVAVMTLLLLADAFAGHYRSGFTFRAQYAPFVTGGLLIASAVAAGIAPSSLWANKALRAAGWLAVASGVIGFGFHHYYGILRKPGGYKWLLHYLMYGAPQLAPLALTVTGALALIAASGLAGETSYTGISLRVALFLFVAVALAGAVLQSGILHYRGAFNNPAMYAPLIAPTLAVFLSILMAVVPNSAAALALMILLWLTFLTGFVGLGMHLRGFERQMGGLYVALFNWLEGPPAFAPALFAGFALVGLIAVYLL